MSFLSTLARRVLAPVVVGAVALAAPACGGSGGYYEPFVGTLHILNDFDSVFTIVAVEVSQPFGPIDGYDVFIEPGYDDFIDLYPDVYDVELFWSDGWSDFYPDVPIYDHDTTPIFAFN